MASEHNDQVTGSDGASGSAEEVRGKHVATRRKLLKAGLAGAPVIITMRSGTAWAVSACFPESGPSPDMADTALDSASGRVNILAYVSDATDQPPGPTAEIDTPDDSTDIDYQIHKSSVSAWTSGPEARKDFYYLAAEAPSCYQSFCGPGGTGSGPGCSSNFN